MIGDNIKIEQRHLAPAMEIFKLISEQAKASEKFAISIGGESGCGKSTLSYALRMVLEDAGLPTYIFHMDDYFCLPPATNHQARLDDIDWVGPGEVKLDLMGEHVAVFKSGKAMLEKPLVHYRADKILSEGVDLSPFRTVIAEGTYTTLLENVDCKIFMLRNYIDTLEARMARARDPIIPFNEKVLEIEHRIISPQANMADIWVDKNYTVKPNSSSG